MRASLAVGIAKLLRRASPKRIRSVLRLISAGAEPSAYEQAKQARDEILTASPYCRGGEACLVRSLATALYCRMRGYWPTWSVGVLAVPPFAAHAWVEAEGRIVDEPLSATDYRAFFKVAV
ncbi:lasso peptide biosynthesis B2 protein [Brevibacterium gallinarum]|uniref:Lasso peptide biosynthesis B2 protein n=1 Tax=Brevibacterium gallinarum TaxID=2762220 RepID=A0ABR8WWX4_9MICO|nr:lasso peptide biosynthesis B2 protein [Brevibacterium gallinarum]